MTKHGETDDFTVNDFVQVMNKHLPRPLDFVLYNNEAVAPRIAERYISEKAIPVVCAEPQMNWVGGSVLSMAGDLARHDSEKLAYALHTLIDGKVRK